jgi:hypothetical protein
MLHTCLDKEFESHGEFVLNHYVSAVITYLKLCVLCET